MVADFRTRGLNCQVSHSIFTEKYRVKGDPLPRLLELPTFGHSDNHAALQVADLLTSALLLPMATYCQGHIRGKHVRGRDKLIKQRYASRLKPLQSRYKRGETTHGGVFVSDRLEGHRSDRLFQFED